MAHSISRKTKSDLNVYSQEQNLAHTSPLQHGQCRLLSWTPQLTTQMNGMDRTISTSFMLPLKPDICSTLEPLPGYRIYIHFPQAALCYRIWGISSDWDKQGQILAPINKKQDHNITNSLQMARLWKRCWATPMCNQYPLHF